MREHLTKLEKASIRLRRLICCMECPGYVGNAPSRRYCHVHCNTEPGMGMRSISAIDVASVARELDVQEVDGAWDFGPCLMPKGI